MEKGWEGKYIALPTRPGGYSEEESEWLGGCDEEEEWLDDIPWDMQQVETVTGCDWDAEWATGAENEYGEDFEGQWGDLGEPGYTL